MSNFNIFAVRSEVLNLYFYFVLGLPYPVLRAGGQQEAGGLLGQQRRRLAGRLHQEAQNHPGPLAALSPLLTSLRRSTK